MLKWGHGRGKTLHISQKVRTFADDLRNHRLFRPNDKHRRQQVIGMRSLRRAFRLAIRPE